ncbi:MAG: DUF2520 domain-containing protein [Desulfuromonadales bacterium]|nr:DUF2520 domain-containing protein [Desulfuromonadales bacterium]
MKERVVLIGPGRLGQAIANLLCEAGYDLRALIGRDPVRALAAARFAGCREAATTDLSRAREGELVLLTLPDDSIGEIAAQLRRQGYLAPGAVLVHFSGIHRAAILLGEEGPALQAFSAHPLQSFPDAVIGVQILPGSPFAIEGSEQVLPLAERLVRDLGGIPFRIAGEHKALYHAAACIASNYLVTLVATAGELLGSCGFDSLTAFRLVAPLLRGTLNNVSVLGPEGALTGPIARGDLRTVEKHLQALAQLPPEFTEIYRVLGNKTAQLAERRGSLTAEKGELLRELLGQGE